MGLIKSNLKIHMSAELSLILAVLVIGFATLFWLVHKKMGDLTDMKEKAALLEKIISVFQHFSDQSCWH